jgi:hypothetical protein
MKELENKLMSLPGVSKGAYFINKERAEQLLKHERTIQDDVLHNPTGELITAVKALLSNSGRIDLFPKNWGIAACRKMLSKSKIERLTIAGALIAAEIDRLIYLENEIKNIV